MFSVVVNGALHGIQVDAVAIWGYALTHPWLPGIVALAIVLKAIELRVRRRRSRRR